MPDTDRSKRTLRNLQIAQRRIIASFKLIKEFVEGYKDEQNAEVPVRLESVIDLWQEFGKVQAELETLDDAPDALDKHLKDRAQFETAYYHVKGFLIQHCPTPLPSSSGVAMSAPPTQSHDISHVKLPDIKLPVFKGDFEHWLNFHDLFISLVHSSTELSNIQKFYYLRSSLGGEALERIQHLEISAIQYPVAWNLLIEHYQNPRALKRKYVQALFDFPVLRRESAADLHSLVEKFEANVRVLKQLGERTEFWDLFLVHCLANRLDPVTRRDWEDYSATNEVVQFKDIVDFIQRRVSVLQQVSSKPVEIQQAVPLNRRQSSPRFGSHGAFQESRDHKCAVCSEDHFIYRCPKFAGLPLEEKMERVRNLQLCRNCLRTGHYLNKCWSESSCRNCGLRHHTLICTSNTTHNERPAEGSRSRQSRDSAQPQPSASVPALLNHLTTTNEPQAYSGVSSCNTQCDSPGSKVVLATAVVVIVDDAGREHRARALLDSGSECCFASNKLINKMNVRPARVDVPITGVGKASTKVNLKFRATVKSRTSDFSTSLDFLILSEVTIDLPSINLDIQTWNIPGHLPLADPAFNESSPIDLVLGAELFFNLFPVVGHISLGDSLPTLTKSVFGWIASGKAICCPQNGPQYLCNVAAVGDTHEPPRHDLEPETTSNCNQHATQTPSFTKLINTEHPRTTQQPGSHLKGKHTVKLNIFRRRARSSRSKKSKKKNTLEGSTQTLEQSNIGKFWAKDLAMAIWIFFWTTFKFLTQHWQNNHPLTLLNENYSDSETSYGNTSLEQYPLPTWWSKEERS